MKKYKSYNSFREEVISHLEKYNPGSAGTYQNTKTGEVCYYKHILHIPEGSTKKNVIVNILSEDKVEADMFEKPQRYAHHLNSSQILCYEFFRPMLNPDRSLKSSLLKFISKNITTVDSNKLVGKFEHIPDRIEKTNFDFFVTGVVDDINVFFEIKYTENGFGRGEKKRHEEKFENIYKPLIAECGCLAKEPTFEEFCKYYQLFRNVLRVTKANGNQEYSVFLYPAANNITEKHFTEFRKKFISGPFENHVIGIHWEDNIEFMSDIFREKFFFYV